MTDVRGRFASNLKDLIDSRDMKPSELGDLAGLSRITIYRYLACKHAPGLEEIALICDVLDVTSTELLGF